MIKKISLCILTIVLLAALFIGTAIWFKIEEKPSTSLEVKSVIYKDLPSSTKINADEWVTSIYINEQIPSFSAAVSINGNLVWAGATGYADLNNQILADTNSIYRIGSISKSITAAALMRLQEQSTLDINDSFSFYAKDFTTQPSDYSLKQLAIHQAGIRHYEKGFGAIIENFNNTQYENTRDAAALVENDPLLFKPGTNFNYSTSGYTLLSLGMELAADKRFIDIIQEEVFSPVGMASTFFDSSTNNTQVTVPYIATAHSILRAPETNLSYKYAGGGIISTPSDLVTFGSALLKNKLISVETKNIMWSPIPLDNQDMNPENYALGFSVGQDELGKFVHHGGKSVGGYAYMVMYPELSIVIAFVTNVTPNGHVFDRHQEAKKLINIFIPAN